MTNVDLKPCPFCGGAARVDHGEIPRTGVNVWKIGCGNEEVDCIATEMVSSYSRRAEAAAAWNKRADDGDAV